MIAVDINRLKKVNCISGNRELLLARNESIDRFHIVFNCNFDNKSYLIAMGGCASKDKKDKVTVEGTEGNDAEGCVSNSMVFLAR